MVYSLFQESAQASHHEHVSAVGRNLHVLGQLVTRFVGNPYMLRSGRRHCSQQDVIVAFQVEFDLTELHFAFDGPLERHRRNDVSAFTLEIDRQSGICQVTGHGDVDPQ